MRLRSPDGAVAAQHPQMVDHRRLDVLTQMMMEVLLQPVVAVEQRHERQCGLTIGKLHNLRIRNTSSLTPQTQH